MWCLCHHMDRHITAKQTTFGVAEPGCGSGQTRGQIPGTRGHAPHIEAHQMDGTMEVSEPLVS